MRKQHTKRYRHPRGGRSKWQPKDWNLLNEFEHEWKGKRRSKGWGSSGIPKKCAAWRHERVILDDSTGAWGCRRCGHVGGGRST